MNARTTDQEDLTSYRLRHRTYLINQLNYLVVDAYERLSNDDDDNATDGIKNLENLIESESFCL